MAGSRLERIGTIFTRVTGLLQSRAMALEDRPIWYDVYKAFPPALPPRYDRQPRGQTLKAIFYPEDVIKAKFHKDMGRKLPAINLEDRSVETLTRKMVNECVRLQNEKQLTSDDAYKLALETIKSESALKRNAERASTDSFVSNFKEASASSTPPPHIDIKSIFNDK